VTGGNEKPPVNPVGLKFGEESKAEGEESKAEGGAEKGNVASSACGDDSLMEASPAQEVEVAEEAEIDKCANKNVSGRGRGRGRGRGKATAMKRPSAATPNSPKRVSFK